MASENVTQDYMYSDSKLTWSNQYLWPVLKKIIDKNTFNEKKCLDLGRGNGATANYLYKIGFEVIGVEQSITGIEIEKR
jgi:2-polyprenyl-3-methyl-5-hydroxy-6-metoxy-1,4-benzoquinol methylase